MQLCLLQFSASQQTKSIIKTSRHLLQKKSIYTSTEWKNQGVKKKCASFGPFCILMFSDLGHKIKPLTMMAFSSWCSQYWCIFRHLFAVRTLTRIYFWHSIQVLEDAYYFWLNVFHSADQSQIFTIVSRQSHANHFGPLKWALVRLCTPFWAS